jgi:DHA1 family bicyclomycin/chloramphenicol resistance-like MFS transporter
MTVISDPVPNPHRGMGFKQFVALIAALMAVNALAIDSMLPALPAIGESLGIPADNQRQWVITAYLLGFGVAQIAFGPLADRFGRKPVLLIGLGGYTVFSIMAAASISFEMMMVARVLQGIGAAASRVLAVSIVRDCYSGRKMARVMSLAFIVFLAVPVIAPSVGQAIMLVAPWRYIFGALAVFGSSVMIWVTLRLPETIHAEDRSPLSPGPVLRAFRIALTSRIAVGYMLASALVLGGLFGFINSAPQIFLDVFKAPGLFTTIFALVAIFMALSSLLNARLVGRLGTRRLSHGALLGYIACAAMHAIVALYGRETIWTFTVLQSGMMFCFGLVASNFSSMAMEPLGHVAGTASSVQGFVTIVGGALLGFLVGQQFDGTVIPLTLGVAGCGIAAFFIVLVTEKGRLFHPTENAASSKVETVEEPSRIPAAG